MANWIGWRLSVVVWLCAPLAAGCSFLTAAPKSVTSPLAPIDLSNDGADLDVLFVRFPLGDPGLCRQLWGEVDELELPSAVRRELAANGMRCGLIGGPLPDMLAKRLTIAEDQSTPAAAAAKLQSESPVRRWRLQAHRGRPGKIVASPAYDQLSLLTCDDGQVRGKTYSQAQGLFSILVDPQGDGRVRLSLTPELEYGDSRQQWVGQDGVLRLQSGKPKQTFDKLKLDIALAPNQTLVLSSLAQRPGSLGHYFFTEPRAGQMDQKLLLIRLAGTKYDDMFAQAIRADSAKPTESPAATAGSKQQAGALNLRVD